MAQPEFLWGVATASYQIEGAVDAAGRLPSIWDTFSATPGKTLGGDTGEHACEHYTRWAEDVDLIAGLGVDAYRLSIAWPRVMHADGTPNQEGLGFYRRLLARLGAHGVQRYVTLYHWDLPQHLEDRGGWLNRDTAYRFAEYAALVARELSGLVEGWMTLNEPWCSAFLGYGNGHHAPGLADPRYATQAMHHLLLGHGLALDAVRQNDPGTPAGIVANVGRGTSDSADPADQEAARLYELQHNDWVLQPLLTGTYPTDLWDKLWPGSAPLVLPGDMAVISQPMDFLGINYYSRAVVSANAPFDVTCSGLPLTDMGWEVYPEGLTDLLLRVHRDYPVPPIYVTENGGAFVDTLAAGRVHDRDRADYIASHIAAVGAALGRGVPMAGYMVWSLMDNFEWASGYAKRFGIVHVDYATQRRTAKDSAFWYRRFLQRQRARQAGPALAVAGS